MKYPLAVRLEARADLIDAALWYESKSPGLSEYFYRELDLAIEQIETRPNSFPQVRKDVRRALVKRFPYAVYFRQSSEHIVVLAILHTARSARVLAKRLRRTK